jgi:hypothetical protein
LYFYGKACPTNGPDLAGKWSPTGFARAAYQRPSGATSRPKVGAFIHGPKVVDFCCRGKKKAHPEGVPFRCDRFPQNVLNHFFAFGEAFVGVAALIHVAAINLISILFINTTP